MHIPGKRLVLALSYLLLLLVILELVSRTEWSHRKGTPFFSPVTYFTYPELGRAQQRDIARDNGRLDILLLAGSVFHEDWGNIPGLLREALTLETGQEVSIHNLSQPGHTSLDSYYKYRHLEGKVFEAVLFYHGINELRLNCCPPPMYREDYGHYAWYRVVNLFETGRASRRWATPFSLYYRFTRLQEKLASPPRYIPRDAVPEEWLPYGRDIKTARAFSSNLSKILEIAARRQEPVVLMTFCYHIPPDYSRERFDNHALDYCLHECPIELWGPPEGIAAGLEVHNAVLRSAADASPLVRFVDQNAILPKEARYFNDVCHLTQGGCEAFVENLLPALRAALAPESAKTDPPGEESSDPSPVP